MKIDYSVVLMVLFFVLPGYCAYWTKHRLTPKKLLPNRYY